MSIDLTQLTYNSGNNSEALKQKALQEGLLSPDIKRPNVKNPINFGGIAQATAGPASALIGNALSGGLNSGVGSALQGLGSIASAIPGPWGAVASAGLNILGGITNKMFGAKFNDQNIANIQGKIDSARQLSLGENMSLDQLADISNTANQQFNFTNGYIGKDGWFSNKVAKKADKLRTELANAYDWQNRTINNALQNTTMNNNQQLEANMFADGGNRYTNIFSNKIGPTVTTLVRPYPAQSPWGGWADRMNQLGIRGSLFQVLNDQYQYGPKPYAAASYGFPIYGVPTILPGSWGGGSTGGGGASGIFRGDNQRYKWINDTTITPIPIMETFNDRFKRARLTGEKTFEFNGGIYGTEVSPKTPWNHENGYRVGLTGIVPDTTITRKKVPVHYMFGGSLDTNGASFDNGYTYIGAGGTHEQNPYEGVQSGVDAQGNPNLVEEGELIWNDYVFSNRLPVDKELKKKYGINTKKKMSFADLSKKLTEESKERPNDPISKAGLDASLSMLKNDQEAYKMRYEAKQAQQLFNSMSPEEQLAIMQGAQMENQQMDLNIQQPNTNVFATGGNKQQYPPILINGVLTRPTKEQYEEYVRKWKGVKDQRFNQTKKANTPLTTYGKHSNKSSKTKADKKTPSKNNTVNSSSNRELPYQAAYNYMKEMGKRLTSSIFPFSFIPTNEQIAKNSDSISRFADSQAQDAINRFFTQYFLTSPESDKSLGRIVNDAFGAQFAAALFPNILNELHQTKTVPAKQKTTKTNTINTRPTKDTTQGSSVSNSTTSQVNAPSTTNTTRSTSQSTYKTRPTSTTGKKVNRTVTPVATVDPVTGEMTITKPTITTTVQEVPEVENVATEKKPTTEGSPVTTGEPQDQAIANTTPTDVFSFDASDPTWLGTYNKWAGNFNFPEIFKTRESFVARIKQDAEEKGIHLTDAQIADMEDAYTSILENTLQARRELGDPNAKVYRALDQDLFDHLIQQQNPLQAYINDNNNAVLQRLENAQPIPISSPTDNKENTHNGINSLPYNNFAQAALFAPIVGSGIQYFSDLLGLSNKFTGDQGEAIRDANGNISYVGYNPVGVPQTFIPTDPYITATALSNALTAANRTAVNNSGANRATAQAQLAANNYNGLNSLGQALATMNETNNKEMQAVQAANNELALQNAQLQSRADEINNQNNIIRTENLIKAAAADEAERQMVATAKSANMSNFFTNIGNLGKYLTNLNQGAKIALLTPGAERYLPNVAAAQNYIIPTKVTGQQKALGGKIKTNKKRKGYTF